MQTTYDSGTTARIHALIDICALEAGYLQRCDKRLFATGMDAKVIEILPDNDDLAERVGAFVARFGRFQDTLGDKLIPEFLKLMQETPGTMLENFDRAERLGLIESADTRAAVRKLRNRMIHECVKDSGELADALNAVHERAPMPTARFGPSRKEFRRASLGWLRQAGRANETNQAARSTLRNGWCRPRSVKVIETWPVSSLLVAVTAKREGLKAPQV